MVGGIVIGFIVYMFASMARAYEKIHGMVDYAENLVGARFGYLAGWFFVIMYQSAGYAIIAWICASFTATMAGHDNVTNSPFVFGLTAFYMVAVFLLNLSSFPIKINNITTVIRIIPLVLMGTIGIVVGVATGGGAFTLHVAGENTPSFLGAVFATVFAYNGWQAAVAFNSEVTESRQKLPLALIIGFVFVSIIYVLYFIGVSIAGDSYLLMSNNQLGTRFAFASVFGEFAADFLLIFVIISGLGILNMCCMGMSRGLYALARRNQGPMPHKMIQLKKGIPIYSMTTAFCISFLWYLVIFANQNNILPLTFDLPDFYNTIFFILLIPIFIGFLIKHYNNKHLSYFNRIIAPILAAIGAGFMIFALVISSIIHAVVYISVFVLLGFIGFLFYKK